MPFTNLKSGEVPFYYPKGSYIWSVKQIHSCKKSFFKMVKDAIHRHFPSLRSNAILGQPEEQG